MTTQEIYKLSEKLTIEEVNEIISIWESNNEKNKIETYESLVRLGDYKELSIATVIGMDKKYDFNFYYNAYNI